MSTPLAPARPRVDKRVLVVDDDPMMRELLTDMLGDLGLRHVHTADSGNSAIEVMKGPGVQPDLVVCDLNMPGGDGFLFMESLAQRQYGGGVILVSGLEERILNSAGLMGRFHRLKVLGTLPKPVQPAALSAALAKLT